MKFIQTRLRYDEEIDQFVKLYLKFTHFYCYQILRKDTSTMKIKFRNHYLRTESAVPTRQESHIDVIAHILRGFTKYRVVH